MKNLNEYWPEDTDTEMYIVGECGLGDILERIQKKWPGAKPEEIMIEPDYIHTRCLGYDLFDSSDWDHFTIIRRKGPGA